MDPCLSDDRNFDQGFQDEHVKKVGCKAPYHRTNKRLKICASKEKIEEANSNLLGRGKKPRTPCTRASTMIFSYDEAEYDAKGSDWFHVILLYPSEYTEIRMVQAIDLQMVIGNAGGYIGHFLGNQISIFFKLINIIQSFIDYYEYNTISFFKDTLCNSCRTCLSIYD